MRRAIFRVVDLLAVAIVMFGIGLLWGWFVGEERAKQRRFEVERKILAEVLASDPAWSHLEIDKCTADGSAYLSGRVNDEEGYRRLRSRVLDLFGETGLDIRFGVSHPGPRPMRDSSGLPG